MECNCKRFSIYSVLLQTIGLQWNMLHGLIPDSWRNLRAETVWLRPGNYQLCGSKPLNATFELCKEVDGKCELLCIAMHVDPVQQMSSHSGLLHARLL